MKTPFRKTSFTLIALALLPCAFVLSACGRTASTAAPAPPPAATVTHAIASVPTVEPTAQSTSAATCPPLDADIREAMNQIEEQVVRLRGIQPVSTVERELLTPDQLRERVEEDFLADYTEQDSRRDALLLSLLGLIEPGLDLHTLYTNLLVEQVSGFYDVQDEELLIVCGSGFAGLEIFTYVHEYVHALQDQAYDLENDLNFSEQACELDGERCFALRALIEGDASLLQEQWLRTYADEPLLESLLASLGAFDSPVFESAPAYIQRELTFPYLSGLSFARSLYLENGWAGVDAAFQTPPVSSEQILHPDRYPRDLPVVLTSPSDDHVLAGSWESTVEDVLGEWATLQILLSALSEEAAIRAAEGWGGDLVILIEDQAREKAAAVLVTQWDTMRDAHEFAAEFFAYGEVRYGQPVHIDPVEATWVYDGGASQFVRHSNQTRWIIASDGDTLSMLQAAFQLPMPVAQ